LDTPDGVVILLVIAALLVVADVPEETVHWPSFGAPLNLPDDDAGPEGSEYVALLRRMSHIYINPPSSAGRTHPRSS
jgi:hypothetical protein